MEKKLIKFCDLTIEHTAFSETYLNILNDVLESADFCNGKFVSDFENAFSGYLGVPYAAGVNSGTSALFLALRALSIGKGDEVIVPANTFVATAWAVVYNGATPVFCDCLQDTFEIDPKSVESKITKKTKAVIGVHMYGQSFDIDKILELTSKHGLYLIEDCSQAHGATYKNRLVGTVGDASCFSFYPSKNLGACGDAGCVLSCNKSLIDKVKSYRIHSPGTVVGDHSELGFNMRMDSFQAAILKEKLLRLDENNSVRKSIASRYESEITNPAIFKQTVSPDSSHVYHIYVVEVEDRQLFLNYMMQKGIECGIQYPLPCHLMSAFSSLGYKKGDLPVSEYLCEHCVSLPVHPYLTQSEIDSIIDACNTFIG